MIITTKLNDKVSIVDITDRFLDNAILKKPEIILVGHWTGGSTAEGAIEHLDTRHAGKGSVGYNFIVERNGTIYMLADPPNYMHNTGLGDIFDQHVIAYALVMRGPEDYFTRLQVIAISALINYLKSRCKIKKHKHHAVLNPKKIDFPKKMWKEWLKALIEYDRL